MSIFVLSTMRVDRNKVLILKVTKMKAKEMKERENEVRSLIEIASKMISDLNRVQESYENVEDRRHMKCDDVIKNVSDAIENLGQLIGFEIISKELDKQ